MWWYLGYLLAQQKAGLSKISSHCQSCSQNWWGSCARRLGSCWLSLLAVRFVVLGQQDRMYICLGLNSSPYLQVNIGLRVLTRPIPSKLPELYRTLGTNYDERVLPSIIQVSLELSAFISKSRYVLTACLSWHAYIPFCMLSSFIWPRRSRSWKEASKCLERWQTCLLWCTGDSKERYCAIQC